MTSPLAAPLPGGRLVEVSDDGAVVTFTLNRPKAGNAITMQLAQELKDAAHWLDTHDTARVLVLTGHGRMFCAGGDLREMDEAGDRTAFLQTLADVMHEAVLALHDVHIPIVAAINGPAAGAGIGLVLAADIALASDAASFTAGYGKVGLSPDCGVTAVLPATVGRRRAALFALTDQTLTAADALDWGLVSHVCPAAELAQRTSEIAGRLSERGATGPTAVLLRYSHRPLPEQLRHEAATIASLGGTKDASKRIAAFVSGGRTGARQDG